MSFLRALLFLRARLADTCLQPLFATLAAALDFLLSFRRHQCLVELLLFGCESLAQSGAGLIHCLPTAIKNMAHGEKSVDHAVISTVHDRDAGRAQFLGIGPTFVAQG